MSGLAAPDASIPEKIASFALPLAAGAAAAIHPAGARGLAGLTSAVNTTLATREFGRREKNERDLGMRLSSLVDTPTGQDIPDLEGMRDVMGTPEGQLPMPTTRPQKLSDVIGRGQTELVRALAQSGDARTAAGLLSGSLAPPRSHPQVVKEWDPATNSYREKVVDIGRSIGQYVGSTRPEEETLSREDISALTRGLPLPPRPGRSGQPSMAPQGAAPAPAPTDAPAAPTTTPPAIPDEPSGSPSGAVAPTAAGLRPSPVTSVNIDPRGRGSVHIAPGTVGWKFQQFKGPNGQPWVYARQEDDRAGTFGDWTAQGPAPVGEKRVELEGQARYFGFRDGTPEFENAVNGLSIYPMIQGDQAKAGFLDMLRSGRSMGGAPNTPPSQPQTAPQSGPPSAPRPSGGGAGGGAPMPTGSPTSFTGLQQAGAAAATQQAATRAGAERASTEAAAYNQKYKVQQLGPEAASKLMLPDGGAVPATWTEERAANAGARDVSDKQREDFGSLSVARSLVRSYDEMTKKLNTETTFLAAQRKGLALRADAATGRNAVAAAYMKERDAFNGRLTKSLGGDSGTLNTQDITRMTNALVNLGDTKQVRDAKSSFLNMIVDVSADAKERAMTGRQTFAEARASIEGRVQDMIKQMEAKPPTRTDVAKARRDARGDPAKAIDLLKQRGFNPMYDVGDK